MNEEAKLRVSPSMIFLGFFVKTWLSRRIEKEEKERLGLLYSYPDFCQKKKKKEAAWAQDVRPVSALLEATLIF